MLPHRKIARILGNYNNVHIRIWDWYENFILRHKTLLYQMPCQALEQGSEIKRWIIGNQFQCLLPSSKPFDLVVLVPQNLLLWLFLLQRRIIYYLFTIIRWFEGINIRPSQLSRPWFIGKLFVLIIQNDS